MNDHTPPVTIGQVIADLERRGWLPTAARAVKIAVALFYCLSGAYLFALAIMLL